MRKYGVHNESGSIVYDVHNGMYLVPRKNSEYLLVLLYRLYYIAYTT